MRSKYQVFGIMEKNSNVLYYKEYKNAHTLNELKQYNAGAISLINHEYIAAYQDIETFQENERGAILIKYNKIVKCISGFYIE